MFRHSVFCKPGASNYRSPCFESTPAYWLFWWGFPWVSSVPSCSGIKVDHDSFLPRPDQFSRPIHTTEILIFNLTQYCVWSCYRTVNYERNMHGTTSPLPKPTTCMIQSRASSIITLYFPNIYFNIVYPFSFSVFQVIAFKEVFTPKFCTHL